MIPALIHVAGALIDGVQVCVRCGEVLIDYRGTMVPEEDADKPMRGWAEGAHVEVAKGVPTFSSVTDEPPNC